MPNIDATGAATGDAPATTESTTAATLSTRMDQADALMRKIEAGTLPGGAGVQSVFPFAPANDTAMTTAAHGLLAVRMMAGISRRGFALARNKLDAGAE